MKIVLVALWLIAPVVVAGVFHMIVVKLNICSWTKKPIWLVGFGANKTWRGVVVMGLTGVFGVWGCSLLESFVWADQMILRRWPPWTLGLSLGLAYAVFELPNSFLKRRLGILPGQSANRFRFFFFLLDHLDSLFGCLMVYVLFFPDLVSSIVWIPLLGPAIHTTVNLGLYAAGIRKNRF